MKKAPKRPLPEGSPQIGVRISPQERLLMGRLIAFAERKSGLAPGTVTPASYARSALLAYMAQALGELEAEGAPADDPGPSPWDRLRENVALIGEETRSKR
jgi:hypothetical protein